MGDFVAIAAYLTSFLLPVLAIMLVTSEWSQRSAMVTFSLEPRRSLVVFAKLVVAVLLTLLTLAVALVIGVVCTLVCEIAQPDLTSWDLGRRRRWPASWSRRRWRCWVASRSRPCCSTRRRRSCCSSSTSSSCPGVFAAANALIDGFDSISPWLDFQAAQDDIYEWNLYGVEEWSHLIVSGLLWLVLPLGFGLWRILRAEVK